MNYYYLGMLRDSAFFALLITVLFSIVNYFFNNVDVFLFYLLIVSIWFYSLEDRLIKYKTLIDNTLICVSIIVAFFIGINVLVHYMLFINATLLIFVLFFAISFIRQGIKE